MSIFSSRNEQSSRQNPSITGETDTGGRDNVLEKNEKVVNVLLTSSFHRIQEKTRLEVTNFRSIRMKMCVNGGRNANTMATHMVQVCQSVSQTKSIRKYFSAYEADTKMEPNVPEFRENEKCRAFSFGSQMKETKPED